VSSERAVILACRFVRAATDRARLAAQTAQRDREAVQALRDLQRELGPGETVRVGLWTFSRAPDGSIRVAVDMDLKPPNGQPRP